MAETNFEKHGGTYTLHGDYLLTDLMIPALQGTYGVWGMRYRQYLIKHDKVKYYKLLCSCKLHEHITDVDVRAEHLYNETIKHLAEQEGVTEKLKAENQILWVQRMNNIAERAREIVFEEVIYK